MRMTLEEQIARREKLSPIVVEIAEMLEKKDLDVGEALETVTNLLCIMARDASVSADVLTYIIQDNYRQAAGMPPASTTEN